MFRADLKSRAKNSMALTKPHAIWVTLIYLLITFGINFVVRTDYNEISKMMNYGMANWDRWGTSLFLTPLLLIAFSLLVSAVEAGYIKYCLHVSRDQPAGIGTLFDLISKLPRFIGLNLLLGLIMFAAVIAPIIVSVVLMIVVSDVFALLMFAGIIPVIYLTLAYSQAMYFAVDDPGMSVVDCLRESRRVMQGRKGEYFVLGLSFFPWLLLVTVTFGIATLWVTPYINITYSNYFNYLVDYQPPVDPSKDAMGSMENPPRDEWYNQ